MIVKSYNNCKIELGDDDVLAIQNQYGKPINTTSVIPLQPPKKEDGNPVDANKIDVCHLKTINTLLIAKKRLCILYTNGNGQ